MPALICIKFGKSKEQTKLHYRKDDRTMHPIYECPENFLEYLTTATFLEILMGFLPIDALNMPTKFEVHSFTHS